MENYEVVKLMAGGQPLHPPLESVPVQRQYIITGLDWTASKLESLVATILTFQNLATDAIT